MKQSCQAFETDDETTPRRFLRRRQIDMIEEALCSLGEYGEVRLVVEKGSLRFIVTQKSFDMLKWLPGSIESYR